MSLSIYFCFHTEEAFNSVFDELFSSADVLIVENGFNGSSSSHWETAYNEMSKGVLTPQQLRSRSGYKAANFSDRAFYEKLQDKIFEQRGKTIYFEHSPLNSQDRERWQEAFKNFNLHDKLKSVMIRYRGLLEMMAADQRKRNQSLAIQLKELVKEYPNGRILLLIGAGHRRVLEKFVRTQIAFSSREMVTPMVGDIQSDLLTKLQLDEDISDLELLRALGEYFEQQEAKKTKTLRQTDFVLIREKVAGLSENALKVFVKKQLAKE